LTNSSWRCLFQALREFVLALVIVALVPATVSAMDLDGYMWPKGHGAAAISFTSQSYDEFWAGTTKVSDPGVGKVDTESWTLWVVHGVSDRLNLVANLPYISTESDGTGGFGQSALQDLSLMGKYRFLTVGSSARSDFIGALGIRTIASNYEIQNSVVDIGDGTADWLARFIYQLHMSRFHLTQSIGWDRRGGDAPNGRPIYTVIGTSWKPIIIDAFYQRLDARGGTDIGSGAPFPSNKEELERAGLKVWGRVSDSLGLSAMYFTTLSGRNTGDASGLAVGVDYSY
jgi:hypothetical protein